MKDAQAHTPKLDSEQPDRTKSRKVLDMSNTNELPSCPTLYTITEAAEQLRVSRWMIYQLIRSNELKTLTIASRRLIASDDLIDFIKQCKEVG
jgi:excisionase family DNA binding protein